MENNEQKKIIIIILILCEVGFLFILAYIFYFMYAFGFFDKFDKDYSVTELKENFKKNKKQIYELKKFLNDNVPNNIEVRIEIEKDTILDLLEIDIKDTTSNNSSRISYSSSDIGKNNYKKINSILNKLAWTKETLKIIENKLYKANCIGISNGEPTEIDFKRHGFGMYSFIVFDNPIPDSLKTKYNNGYTYILVNDYLALEFSGGAIGPQSFYKKD